MANVVEVIIQGKDETGAAFNQSSQGAERLGRAIENGPNISLRSLRRAAIVAVAALYGLERGLEAIVGRAKDLGFTKVSDDFDKLKASVQQLGDAILTSPLFGNQTVLTLLDQGFQNLIPVVRAFGVVVAIVAGGIDLLYLQLLRAKGALDELTGKTTEYTDAWYQAAKAQAIASHNEEIGLIWTGKLTDAIKEQNNVLLEGTHNLADWNKGQVANVKTLEDMIKANKQLNDEYSKRKSMEDAIRAGDARALADAMYGGGGGGNAPFRGTGRSGGGNAGRPGSNNKGDNVNVYVSIAGKEVAHVVRKEIVKSVFGQNGKSDASRFPGKGQ